MQKNGDQLTVRQHERYACRLPVDIGIAAESPSRVTLSSSVGSGTGRVGATVVDCSAGGVGIESGVYLPRMARLHLRIEGTGGEPIELEGTVQRSSMISRAPRYYLGISFRGGRGVDAPVLERLMRAAAAAGGSST